MHTQIEIHGLIPDLYGLSRIFPAGQGNALEVHYKEIGRVDGPVFETGQRGGDKAFARGPYVTQTLENTDIILRTKVGEHIAEILNAAGYLGDVLFKPVRAGAWSLATLGGSFGTPSRPSGGNHTRTTLGRHPRHLITSQRIFQLMQQNEAVRRVFKILEQGPSWVSLNIVLEEIAFERGKSLGNLHETGFVSRRKVQHFKAAANTARDLNQGIRHGRTQCVQTIADAMSLEEAHSVVRKSIYRWIDELVAENDM